MWWYWSVFSPSQQSEAFRKPVPAKVVPDYYNVIKFPMDLQTMKEVRVQGDIILM